MADAIITVVVDRIAAIIEKQIRYEVNLVRGVEKEVVNLSDELKTIRYVLDDAETRRFEEESINDWLKKLEDTAYEMDDVLDEWNYAILKLMIEPDQSEQKVRTFNPCLCFKRVVVRRDIAIKIKIVKERLDQVLKEKDRYNFVMSQPKIDHTSPKSWRVQSTSSIELEKVQGRNRDRDHIVSKLSDDSFVLSIVGVGGLGKTTLAQLVFNDSRVEKSFDLKIWVCVSDPFDLAAISKGIIESVNKGDSPSTNNLETLLQCTRQIISGKKILLVLDDVWTEDNTKWEPLKSNLRYSAPGSKVLVTTRNERVAKVMGTIENDIYHPEQLSDEECWSLLRGISLFGRSEAECQKFEDIGREIAIKCKGLPLAAKTLGSLLQFKNSLEEWENVLQNEIWQMEEAEVDLFPHLLLSYNELSPALKRCFSYCAVFPKDWKIEAEKLIGIWMALGYLGSNVEMMELKGWEYVQILAARCLFQDIEKMYMDERIISFRMHDIVHDFANFVRKGRSPKAVTSCQFCGPLLISNVKVYRSFLLFPRDKGPSDICDCLTSIRALDLNFCDLNSFPHGMEKLIHLRWLDLSNYKWSEEDVKTICMLYNLQTLFLSNCGLEETPGEIGNLIHLKHLDLSRNPDMERLPDSICGLYELQTLNVEDCWSLVRLPEAIHGLINLQHLHCNSVERFPQGLAQLTSLRTLGNRFCGGIGWNKFGWLKNLNHLSGSVALEIHSSSANLIKDAAEAELHKKMHIQRLLIDFQNNESSVVMGVLDGLKPHRNLPILKIHNYTGAQFPDWITSPLNRLRKIEFEGLNGLTSIPPFGKLPCLEEIYFYRIMKLQFLGRDFLGITTAIQSPTAAATIAFPRLKQLRVEFCSNLEEWEDITVEEEECADVRLMPCLTTLIIKNCPVLTALPQRLLHKASSLEVLDVCGSINLIRRYKNEDGKSISQQNPRLRFEFEVL